jgi:hypothetical protein
MTDGRRGAIAEWLIEAERAFANVSQIFEQFATGEYELTPTSAERISKTTREFASQARQLRALIVEEVRRSSKRRPE